MFWRIQNLQQHTLHAGVVRVLCQVVLDWQCPGTCCYNMCTVCTAKPTIRSTVTGIQLIKSKEQHRKGECRSLTCDTELPRGDCFADSTPLGFNTFLQGAAHLGRLTGFACKSFSIVNPRGRQLKALCRQLRVWNFFWSLEVWNLSSVETKWC